MTKTKHKEVKSSEMRKAETDEMKSKIEQLGFGPTNPDIKAVYDKLDSFVAQGHSESFKVKLNGFKRIAVGNLCTRPHTSSNLTLKYAEHV